MVMTKPFAAAALFMLTGCLSETVQTTVVVDEDANNQMVFSMDLITADSPELADAILNSARGGWFDNKAAYFARYRDRLAANHYQFVPDLTKPGEVEWPNLEDGDAVYLVAGNFVAGPRILKVEPDKLAGIRVAADDFILSFN